MQCHANKCSTKSNATGEQTQSQTYISTNKSLDKLASNPIRFISKIRFTAQAAEANAPRRETCTLQPKIWCWALRNAHHLIQSHRQKSSISSNDWFKLAKLHPTAAKAASYKTAGFKPLRTNHNTERSHSTIGLDEKFDEKLDDGVPYLKQRTLIPPSGEGRCNISCASCTRVPQVLSAR